MTRNQIVEHMLLHLQNAGTSLKAVHNWMDPLMHEINQDPAAVSIVQTTFKEFAFVSQKLEQITTTLTGLKTPKNC